MPRTGLRGDVSGEVVMAMRPSGVVQNLTIGAASVVSTVFTAVNQDTTYLESTGGPPVQPSGCTHVRLCSTTDVWVLFGSAPVATASNAMLLPAGVVEYFAVDALDKIAGIQVSAGGTLNISEMS